MRNEDCRVIRLTHTSAQSDIIFYHFSIKDHSNFYQLSCRYSKLRTISAMLPKTKAKFPEPCSFTMALSSLLGNSALLEKRFEALKKYFDQVSTMPQLIQNKGFKRLLEESELVQQVQGTIPKFVPRTPHICGKKIGQKELTDELLIMQG